MLLILLLLEVGESFEFLLEFFYSTGVADLSLACICTVTLIAALNCELGSVKCALKHHFVTAASAVNLCFNDGAVYFCSDHK